MDIVPEKNSLASLLQFPVGENTSVRAHTVTWAGIWRRLSGMLNNLSIFVVNFSPESIKSTCNRKQYQMFQMLLPMLV